MIIVKSFQVSLLLTFVVLQFVQTLAHEGTLEMLGKDDEKPNEDEEDPTKQSSNVCSTSDLFHFEDSGVLYDNEELLEFFYSIVPLAYNEGLNKYEKISYDDVPADEVELGLNVRLKYSGMAWLSVGLSSKDEVERMIGAQVVIGLPDEAKSPSNPGKYDLISKFSSGIQPMDPKSQTLIDASITQSDKSTILEYTKILKENGEYGIDPYGATTFIWSFGFGNNLSIHKQHGGFLINPGLSCSQKLISAVSNENDSDKTNQKESEDIKSQTYTSTEKDYSDDLVSSNTNMNSSVQTLSTMDTVKTLWVVHGVFATMAWSVAAPLAIMSAIFRYAWSGPSGGPNRSWFKLHFVCNMLCILFTFISFFTAVAAVLKTKDDHFDEPHKLVGLLIFIFVTIQVIFAVCRPGIGETNTNELMVKKPIKRVLWEISHRTMGMALVGASIWQVHSGFDQYDEHFGDMQQIWYYILYVWIGILFLMTSYGGFKGFFYES